MLDANPVRRLKDTNPQLEVWWDSSPLVYADWLAGAGSDHRAARLFDLVPSPDGQTFFAPDSLLDGATTNQPLTWQVLEQVPGDVGRVAGSPARGGGQPGCARGDVADPHRGGGTRRRHADADLRGDRPPARADLLPGGPARPDRSAGDAGTGAAHPRRAAEHHGEAARHGGGHRGGAHPDRRRHPDERDAGVHRGATGGDR